MSRVLAFLLFVCLIVCVSVRSVQAASKTEDERPWPRQYTVNGTQFSVYRPELDSWTNNQLQCRAVMAVRIAAVTDDAGASQERYRYGVVWLKARTERLKSWTTDDPAYWIAFCLDQFLHQMTYLAMAAFCVIFG